MTRRQQGLIVYGPPAAGKDTVTGALADVDGGYAHFRRLKVGSGKSSGYRMGTPEQLAQLRAEDGVVYENHRYSNTYVIDRPGLDAAFAAGLPVVHLGQLAGIRAVVDGYPADWATVLLWCPREVTAARSKQRGDADTDARLAVWDATKEDLDAHPGVAWDLVVETARTAPADAARLIHQLLAKRAGTV
jgi:guanylate kinase